MIRNPVNDDFNKVVNEVIVISMLLSIEHFGTRGGLMVLVNSFCD